MIELFNKKLDAAEQNGFHVLDYEKDEPFGDYAKGSVASLQGAMPSWGHRLSA